MLGKKKSKHKKNAEQFSHVTFKKHSTIVLIFNRLTEPVLICKEESDPIWSGTWIFRLTENGAKSNPKQWHILIDFVYQRKLILFLSFWGKVSCFSAVILPGDIFLKLPFPEFIIIIIMTIILGIFLLSFCVKRPNSKPDASIGLIKPPEIS